MRFRPVCPLELYNRASFDFGKDRENEYAFGSTGGPIDYYLLYGPSPKQVVEDYAWLTGPTPLPPMWVMLPA